MRLGEIFLLVLGSIVELILSLVLDGVVRKPWIFEGSVRILVSELAVVAGYVVGRECALLRDRGERIDVISAPATLIDKVQGFDDVNLSCQLEALFEPGPIFRLDLEHRLEQPSKPVRVVEADLLEVFVENRGFEGEISVVVEIDVFAAVVRELESYESEDEDVLFFQVELLVL